MDILTAMVFLSLQPELWIGQSLAIGNSNIDLTTEIKSRIELFNPEVAACTPDLVNYNLKIGFNIDKEYRIELEENCLHGVSKPSDSDIVNYHAVKFIRKNLK